MTRDGEIDQLSKLLAEFVQKVSEYTALDLALVMLAAETILSVPNNAKAHSLLHGMCAGIQQAQYADLDQRVVSIWYDDNSAPAAFSWAVDERPGPEYEKRIRTAIESALRPNGASDGTDGPSQ